MKPEETDTSKPEAGVDVTVPVVEHSKSPEPVDTSEGSAVPDGAIAVPPAAEDVAATPQEENHDTASEASQPPAEEAKPEKKRPHVSGPVIPIAAAVIVAVGLAVVAVVSFVQPKEVAPSQTSDTATLEEAKPEPTPAATESDIDEATKVIDEIDAQNDGTDFPDAEVSDETLGL